MKNDDSLGRAPTPYPESAQNVFAPAGLLPEQILLKNSFSPWYQKLCLNIFRYAILDKDVSWFESNDYNWPLSFVVCCAVVGIDPAWARTILSRGGDRSLLERLGGSDSGFEFYNQEDDEMEEDVVLFSCELTGDPVPQSRPSCRCKPFPTVYYTKRSSQYRADLVKAFELFSNNRQPIDEPVAITLKIFCSDRLFSKADSDNIQKQVGDALAGTVILDDNMSILRSWYVITYEDNENPRIEVIVERFDS